jgi:hypothetical protein
MTREILWMTSLPQAPANTPPSLPPASLEAVLEHMADAFFVLDLDECVTYINARGCALLRRTRAELLGVNIWAAFPAALNTLFDTAVHQSLADGSAITFEAHYPPLDTWFEVRVFPSATGASVFFRDINAERADAATQRLLDEISDTLASSLDYAMTTRRVAELVVPPLADLCTVAVVEPGAALRRVAVVVADPAKRALADALVRLPLEYNATSGLPRAVRTGQTQLCATISATAPDPALSPEFARVQAALGVTSAIDVPLVARGRVIGGMGFVYCDSGRHYSAADLPVIEEIARRAALAIDNADLLRAAQLS